VAGIGRFAGDYSFAQAAKIPKALSEIIVATMSTVIGAQSPDSFSPGRHRSIGNVAEVRRFLLRRGDGVEERKAGMGVKCIP
jgi:hypothetical protein